MQNTQAQKATANNMAMIKSGVNNQAIPCAGKTVAQVRRELGGAFGIDPEAKAYKGKTQLSDTYVIESSDNIEFVRKLGEKG